MKSTKSFGAVISSGIVAVFLMIASPAHATLLDFDLAWSGSLFGNGASAVATLTLDDTIFANPVNDTADAATLGITAFQITISGASSGNGTFGLSNIEFFTIEFGTFALDLTSELVGQSVLELGGSVTSPFGTPNSSGEAGNFIFLGNGNDPLAPEGGTTGTACGITTAGITGDSLVLTSFAPAEFIALPEPGTLNVVALGLFSLALIRRKRAPLNAT